jgi:uncharacterized protein
MIAIDSTFRALVLAMLMVLLTTCTNKKEPLTFVNPVNFFEIPVTDMDRAVQFYAGAFEYTFERTIIDGNEMALFPSGESGKGISGALVKGDTYTPSVAGTRIYFSTGDINKTLKRVQSLGGKVLYPKTAIGQLGYVAEFQDTEGNRIALHSQR